MRGKGFTFYTVPNCMAASVIYMPPLKHPALVGLIVQPLSAETLNNAADGKEYESSPHTMPHAMKQCGYGAISVQTFGCLHF
jgi:hypothetical protein